MGAVFKELPTLSPNEMVVSTLACCQLKPWLPLLVKMVDSRSVTLRYTSSRPMFTCVLSYMW